MCRDILFWENRVQVEKKIENVQHKYILKKHQCRKLVRTAALKIYLHDSQDPEDESEKKPTCIFIFCIFIHILIKLVSFFSETLTFNWVCITVIIKWKGNEVSVSTTCHRYTLTLTWERVEGGLALPLMRHTMATTTQLTLSIYTTPHMHADTHTHTHTNSGGEGVKRLFFCFFLFYWSCDSWQLHLFVGPVKLDEKNLRLELFDAN